MNLEKNMPETVDKYIAGFPDHIQQRMHEIRKLIHKAAPNVQEKISWGMPTFFINKNRIHFAAHKNHLGLYPGAEPIVRYKKELAAYHTSKGAIQLPNDQPLPLLLITKIVKAALNL